MKCLVQLSSSYSCCCSTEDRFSLLLIVWGPQRQENDLMFHKEWRLETNLKKINKYVEQNVFILGPFGQAQPLDLELLEGHKSALFQAAARVVQQWHITINTLMSYQLHGHFNTEAIDYLDFSYLNRFGRYYYLLSLKSDVDGFATFCVQWSDYCLHPCP